MSTDELPRRWMSPGSHDVWGPAPGHTHYKPVPYDVLPALPALPASRRPNADPFAWLRLAPPRGVRERLAFGQGEDNAIPRLLRRLTRGSVAGMVKAIASKAKREGLTVPASYVTFMSDPSLQERVPTCTSCYLDVPTKLVAPPGEQPGKLLRFMNDQQCGMLWYLHLTPDAGCTVVYGVPVFDDDDEDEDQAASFDDLIKLGDVATCAPTFEDFIHRFWMENTLWFSLYEKTKAPLTPEQQAYLDAVKKALPSL